MRFYKFITLENLCEGLHITEQGLIGFKFVPTSA